MITSTAWRERSLNSSAAPFEHVGRGLQGGDRRAQLVADVGDEPALALDAGLHGVGHAVERLHERRQVGVALGRDAGVEVAGGDLLGRLGHPAERAQQAPAGPDAERAEQRPRPGSTRR